MSNYRRMDKLIVVDIEATCWHNSVINHPPTEIIEIGVCEVINEKEPIIGRQGQYYVKPTESYITSFCTELTGITDDTLKEAKHLEAVVPQFKDDFQTNKFIWVSWGDYDRSQFTRECCRKNIQYPFSTRHINLKSLFSSLHMCEQELSVKKALKLAGMEFIGEPHCGKDDAYNIGRLLISTYSLFRRG